MLVVRALALFALGAAAGYAVNAVRPDGVPLSGFEAPHACGGGGGVEIASVIVLSAEDAASAIDAGSVLLLDARSAAAYEQGHVDSAMHLHCASASHAVDHAVALAAGAGAVIVYGDGLADARPFAEDFAAKVGASPRVSVVDGGYDALVRAGAPAESGSCERCTTSEASP